MLSFLYYSYSMFEYIIVSIWMSRLVVRSTTLFDLQTYYERFEFFARYCTVARGRTQMIFIRKQDYFRIFCILMYISTIKNLSEIETHKQMAFSFVMWKITVPFYLIFFTVFTFSESRVVSAWPEVYQVSGSWRNGGLHPPDVTLQYVKGTGSWDEYFFGRHLKLNHYFFKCANSFQIFWLPF